MPPVGSAVALWALTGLFFLRVIGQVLVAFFAVPVLPPMAYFDHNALYHVIQALALFLMYRGAAAALLIGAGR